MAGASGSGKSSLVIAGALPAIAAETSMPPLCIVPPFVPGNAVLEHLADAVLKSRGNKVADLEAQASALRQDPQHLSAMVEQTRPTLITIDQFEEVFTLSASADRDALAANLGRLLEAERGHRVILTVREEFRSHIVELPALSPYLNKAWYSMRPMGYDALRAAIEKSAKLQNLQFQSGIVDDLAKKVLGQPAALPLLQFALQSLWEKRDRNRITWEVYDKIGRDPLNALKSSADRFYDGLAPQTQEEVKRVLLELVRVDELLEAYRRPIPKRRLLQAGKANTEDVLRLLDNNQYIRIRLSGTDAVVEVKHEALVRNWPRLVGWIDEKRIQVRQRLALTQAAQGWAHDGKPAKRLMTAWQLQAAQEQSDLSDVEADYVQASAKALDREKVALRRQTRVFRRLALTAFAAALMAIVLFVVALWQRIEIERQDEYKMQALKLQPLHYMSSQLDLALLLSVEAALRAPDKPEVLASLLTILTTNLDIRSMFPGHAGTVRAVRYSPDWKVLASAFFDETSNEGAVILRDPESGHMLYPPMRGHRGYIFDLAFSADGQILASASDDKSVRLWNVKTGDLKKELSNDSENYGVAINRDETLLASAGENGLVTLWDLKSYEKKVLAHSEPPAKVRRVAFSPDGALLASGGEDGRIVLWDVRTSSQVGKPLIVNHEVFSMAFSHDGKTIASGSQDGNVDLWNVATRDRTKKLSGHSRGVFGVAFGPDDKQLASVASDRSVYVHDLDPSKDETQELKGYAARFFSVDFAKDGKLATGTGDGMVIVWDTLRVGGPLRAKTVVQQLNSDPSAGAVFTADEKMLVSYSGGTLQFWPTEMSVESPRSVAARHQTNIKLSVPAPNGKDLATIDEDNSVELWDLTKRQSIATLLQPSKDEILAAAYSGDSRTLAISVNNAKNEGQIWLLDTSGGKRSRFEPKETRFGPVYALAFSPKDNLLAIGNGREVSVWNLGTAENVKSFDHTDDIYSLAFSPDGKRLASGGRDGAIRLWDMGGDSRESGASLDSHKGPVRSVAFSPDGKRLASGDIDKSVLLWDVDTRLQLTSPVAHGAAVSRLAFSPSGRWMVSTDEDGIINLWTLNVPSLLYQACRIAGRNLTAREWKRFFGDERFHVTCPTATADQADALALAGDRAGAEQRFDDAVGAALKANEPVTANHVCWLGSADGFARIVKPACEQAVELAPEGTKSMYRDSRGLARALTGDSDGAIGDFAAFVEYVKQLPDPSPLGPELVRQREDWIAALKKGHNPFDDQLLHALRTE